jgi:WD40 repeat protein
MVMNSAAILAQAAWQRKRNRKARPNSGREESSGGQTDSAIPLGLPIPTFHFPVKGSSRRIRAMDAVSPKKSCPAKERITVSDTRLHRLPPRWSKLAIGVGLCAAVLACGVQQPTREPVRAELSRLQKQTGLSLAYFDETLDTIVFEDRSVVPEKKPSLPGKPVEGSVSPDGVEVALSYWDPRYDTKLGIIQRDGTNLREITNCGGGYDFCWSHDKSRLAMVVQNPQRLVILNLGSGETREVQMATSLSSQCWSPDDKQIVFEFFENVRTYNIERGKWTSLVKGKHPSWSPDGNQIAFLDDNTYYAIRPSGEDRKLLFMKERAVSGLWWSPDGKFVAYVSHTKFPEKPWLVVDVGFVRVRIRRLEDNSEDWVAGFSEVHVPSFQWVQLKQSLK